MDVESKRIAMGRTIGILIFPDFQLLDAAGPISVFEVASRFAGRRTVIKPLAL
jgi:transcriptional regulator GlxA family with amidase domain